MLYYFSEYNLLRAPAVKRISALNHNNLFLKNCFNLCYQNFNLLGLQKLDKTGYEAASIDGANLWIVFENTLPGLHSLF